MWSQLLRSRSVAIVIGWMVVAVPFIFGSRPSKLFTEIHDQKRHEHQPLPINPNSTIARDVSAIWHDGQSGAVCVKLREGARCPSPSFVGRLSGPVLVALEWNEASAAPPPRREPARGGTLHCGSYADAWLSPGDAYHVEVLVMHCNDFGARAIAHGNLDEVLNFDYAEECLEDVANNRVTGASAVVSIRREIKGRGTSAKGHWVPIGGEGGPLRTRYQPPNCFGVNGTTKRCADAMGNAHATAFSFEFRDEDRIEEKVQPFQVDLEPVMHIESGDLLDKNVINGRVHAWDIRNWVRAFEETIHGHLDGPRVCVVGASHSNHLVFAFYQVRLGHKFVWASAEWPDDATLDFFEDYHHQLNCTKFLVSLGQWPPSWKADPRPWTFAKYKHEMSRIARVFSESPLDMQVYFRSTHHVVIGDFVAACGGGSRRDWRSTTVIDAFNYIVREVVADSNSEKVHYIDTEFIINPLWDTGYDWNHIHPRVSRVEALYIASEILTS